MSRPALTYGLRELVWGIEAELAVIANLSHLIDQHVLALNVVRRDLAERLSRLDALCAEADDPRLLQFLRDRTAVTLPSVHEHLPARLAAGPGKP